MTKQEQIEEMAKDLENTILGLGIHLCRKSAEKLYDLGYRKGETISYQAMIDHSYLDRINQLENRLVEVRKKTAEEIINEIVYCARINTKAVDGVINKNSFMECVEVLAKKYGVEVEE